MGESVLQSCAQSAASPSRPMPVRLAHRSRGLRAAGLIVAALVVLLLALPGVAAAKDSSARKLGRGASNVALGVAALPREIYRKAGAIGHIGCTSFYPSKNLGAYGDAGAIYTDDDELAQKLHMIANHGQTRRYYHGLVGVNSRLDSIQAAILDIKLRYLDDYAAARQAAASYYDQAFAGIGQLQTPKRHERSTHVFHQYTLIVKDGRRDELQAFLSDKGIPTMIYYPVPLYEQDAYRESMANDIDTLPVTDSLCRSVISLPMHTELEEEMLAYISKGVKAFFE